jgi:hypothetical protein
MAGFDNLDDLTGTLEDYLERADLRSRIPTFIRLAEVRLDRRLNLADNETTLALPLVDGASPLPGDFRSWRSVSGPCGEVLDYVPPHAFASGSREPAWYGGRHGVAAGTFTILGSIPLEDIVDSTDPWLFGLDNPFIRVAPQFGSVTLVYRQGIPPLSDAFPANWLLAKHPDLYLYAALLEAEPFLRNDTRMVTWRAMLEAGISDLKSLDRDARWGRSRMRTVEPTP